MRVDHFRWIHRIEEPQVCWARISHISSWCRWLSRPLATRSSNPPPDQFTAMPSPSCRDTTFMEARRRVAEPNSQVSPLDLPDPHRNRRNCSCMSGKIPQPVSPSINHLQPFQPQSSRAKRLDLTPNPTQPSHLNLANRPPPPSGTRIRITIPSGHTPAISYNCTHPANTNTTAPTIWFESTPGHGVLDFLGVQHHLATAHNLSSCSYDPPNYGWSDALPATTLANDTDYLPALLRALGLQERGQRRVLVGWGGGLELAVRHAVVDPGATAAVVDVEGGPDGIEWLDAQRAHGWTEGQRLEYRKADIDSRISLTKLILSIGLGLCVSCCGSARPSHLVPSHSAPSLPSFPVLSTPPSLSNPAQHQPPTSPRHQMPH